MDIVSLPERVVFDRAVHVVFVMFVIGITVVLVLPARAHAVMFGHGMSLVLLVVLSAGHEKRVPCCFGLGAQKNRIDPLEGVWPDGA